MEEQNGETVEENPNQTRVVGYKSPPHPPFAEGNPGGPGRPQGSLSITKYIRLALAENDDKKAKQLAEALILQAAKGNGTAVKEVMGRIDGVIPTDPQVEYEYDGMTLEENEQFVALLAKVKVKVRGSN